MHSQHFVYVCRLRINESYAYKDLNLRQIHYLLSASSLNEMRYLVIGFISGVIVEETVDSKTN